MLNQKITNLSIILCLGLLTGCAKSIKIQEIPSNLTEVPSVQEMPDWDFLAKEGKGQNELSVYLPELYGAYAVCSGNMQKIKSLGTK